jgi:hypothetical protein
MLYPVELRALSVSLCLKLLPIHTTSVSRCPMLAFTLRIYALIAPAAASFADPRHERKPVKDSLECYLSMPEYLD